MPTSIMIYRDWNENINKFVLIFIKIFWKKSRKSIKLFLWYFIINLIHNFIFFGFMTYFSFSWWYKFSFYINYLSISSLNFINVSLSYWLFLIAFLSLNSTKFSLDLSLMNSFPLNTFILIFVLKFFSATFVCT